MKGKTRLLLISAVLILGMFAKAGTSWGADPSPLLTGTPPDTQTVVAQAAAATQPAGTATPAQTQTTPATPPPAASTTAPDNKSVPVTEVTVTAQKPKEGSAEAGYKVDTVKNVGPWGEKAILDTPYSMTVIPEELLKNTISNSTDQIFKMSPMIQLLMPYDFNGLTRVMMRGFLIQNQMIDGVQANYAGEGLFVENIQRIEVLNGLSGFMYGVGNVGGTLNYVTKQPTSVPLHDFTVGDYGGSQMFAHADVGGPLDKDGKFAYRLNFMTQSGDTPLKDQSLNRYMLSGAFDWHVLDNLKVSVDAMDGHYQVEGKVAQWGLANTTMHLPSAPDPGHLWASPDTFNQNDTTRIGSHLTYDINDMFTFRAGYGRQRDDRQYVIAGNTITSQTAYTLGTSSAGEIDVITTGGYAYIDTKFSLFGVSNKLTAGFNGYTYLTELGRTASGASSVTLGSNILNQSLSNPSSADNVTLPNFNFDSMTMAKSSVTTSKNSVIGDDIKFNDQWEALLGINYSEYMSTGYSLLTGATSSEYDKTKATPTYSLLYKPLPYITTYASYIESLTQGVTVTNSGSTIYTNNVEIFQPYVSKQYEVGAKAQLGKALLTAALFDIEKANTYVQNNGNGTYTEFQNGKEVHKGIEVTLSGKVTSDLTLLGGITQMTCNVEKATNPLAIDKIPQGVADQLAKLYAEYNLPWVRGLTATGGVYYTGKSYVNVQNTQVVPSYATEDVGLRYRTTLNGYDTIFRAILSNITDKHYWMSDATVGTVNGAPRTLMFSATMRF